MGSVIFRFCIVWFVLHIILFFTEMYRYKHSNWSWYGFKNYGMLDITYIILCADILGFSVGIVMLIIGWIFQPIIK